MTDQNSGRIAVELLKDLIRCPSVTPNQAGALDVVEAFLTNLGFVCTRKIFESDGSYPVDNLFATIGARSPASTNQRHLLFCGHTDVVPTGDEALWTHDPFSGLEQDGIVWGRGAVDMKSGVAAFCAAAASFVASSTADGAVGTGQLSFIITNDEEADAINGSKKLLKWAADQGHAFDFAIVGEPSSATQLGDSIKIGRRGSLSGVVTVTGKQGHSAYPERAANPVPVLAHLAHNLSQAELDNGSAHFQSSNLEVTSLDVGNKAANVIPASSQLGFNIRFNDHWSGDSLSDWIESQLAQLRTQDIDISWKLLGAVARSFVSDVNADIEALSEAVEQVTGRRPAYATFGGTSDARFVIEHCPVVECGLVGAGMHEVNERVPVADVAQLTKIYEAVLVRFFQ